MAPKDRTISGDDGYGFASDLNEDVNPPLEKLFDQNYLRKPMTPLNWVVLILWTPFGTVLSILRILLTALLCLYANLAERYFPSISPSDKTLFWMICMIAGVHLRKIEGKISSPEELEHSFIVSNHTFTGDPGLLHFMLDSNARVVHKSNVGSFDIITRHKICVGDNKSEVKETILKGIRDDPTPVVIYPEGATTNGLVGLLRYSAFIFSLGRPVFPVGLKYYPALPFIPFHSVRPWYSFHMFLVGFQPWIFVEAVTLPAQNRSENETPEQFADRVQRMTAKAIGLIPTKYSANDKSSLRKRMSQVNLPSLDKTQ